LSNDAVGAMFALDVFAISTLTPKLLLMSSARNGVTLYVFALTPVSENVGSVAVAAGLADDVGAVEEPLAGVDACAFAVGVAVTEEEAEAFPLGDPLAFPPGWAIGVGLEPPPPPLHAANASIATPNATKVMGGFDLLRNTIHVVYRIARPFVLARGKVSLTKDSCLSANGTAPEKD